MSFHAFGQWFQLFINTAQQEPENMLSKLPINENRLEKLLLVCFLFPFFLGRWSKNNAFFGPHCIIPAYIYELKVNIQTNFDTLISNLKSHFQYKIVMTSL